MNFKKCLIYRPSSKNKFFSDPLRYYFQNPFFLNCRACVACVATERGHETFVYAGSYRLSAM